jgi:hypothetical protein
MKVRLEKIMGKRMLQLPEQYFPFYSHYQHNEFLRQPKESWQPNLLPNYCRLNSLPKDQLKRKLFASHRCL